MRPTQLTPRHRGGRPLRLVDLIHEFIAWIGAQAFALPPCPDRPLRINCLAEHTDVQVREPIGC